MQRFKNILVYAAEDSAVDAAMSRALGLAAENDAMVHIIDVVDNSTPDLAALLSTLSGGRGSDIGEQLERERWAHLEALAGQFRSAGVPVRCSLRKGSGFAEAIRAVLEDGHDLLIKGADTSGGLAQRMFTGRDMHLMRKCPCPVWIAQPSPDVEGPKRILAAVDPDPTDTVRAALATQVLEMASSLARLQDAELHVVNAWYLQEEQALRSRRYNIDPKEIQHIVDATRLRSAERFNALIQSVLPADSAARIEHLKGRAEDVIPDYVEANGISKIVTGTIGRTGVSGVFIGNTAETILGRVHCSVIAVKPQGFISPVTMTPQSAT